MKKFLILFVFTVIPLLVFAQASGGQIRRPVQIKSNNIANRATSSSKSHGASHKSDESASINISESDRSIINIVVRNVKSAENAQMLCESLIQNGYSPTIYYDTNIKLYRVIVWATEDHQEALYIRNKVKSEYPDVEFFCSKKGQINYSSKSNPEIKHLSNSLPFLYNVVVRSVSIRENAYNLYGSLKSKGYSPTIYNDVLSGYYRVIIWGTSDKHEAYLFNNQIKKDYPDAEIMIKK